MDHQARYGFSKWLIVHRETGQPIGDSGPMHLPDGVRVELGYRLARPYWGAGYAEEVARGWLTWWDTHQAGRPLYADVLPDHTRSQHILSKLGFERSHLETVFDQPMWIYERVRPQTSVKSL